jgi:hypothetical protein
VAKVVFIISSQITQELIEAALNTNDFIGISLATICGADSFLPEKEI